MATKKTSMFTLTERVTISAATTDTFATIDLGSYVDVGDRQALQVHSVDFIFQGTTASELFAAVGRVRPGGTILLADGHYRLPRVVRLAEKRHILLDAKASNLV